MAEAENRQADYLLDITKDRCPMTFVKTRLMLDKMQSGGYAACAPERRRTVEKRAPLSQGIGACGRRSYT